MQCPVGFLEDQSVSIHCQLWRHHKTCKTYTAGLLRSTSGKRSTTDISREAEGRSLCSTGVGGVDDTSKLTTHKTQSLKKNDV